jgi:hypothetical protein
VYAEKFELWRLMARQARATLAAAERVRHRKPVPGDVWATVPGWTDRTREFSWQGQFSPRQIRLNADRLQLRDAVNHWLETAQVRPCFSESGLRFTNLRDTLAHGGSPLTLYGALALQLAIAASGAQSMVVCSWCKYPYSRVGRRPAAGRDNYCPSCFKSGAPMRAARERYRRRLAEKERRATRGKKTREG